MLNKRKTTNVRLHIEGFHSYENNWNKWRRREERTGGRGSEKTLGAQFTWWKCSRARGGVGVTPWVYWVPLSYPLYSDQFQLWSGDLHIQSRHLGSWGREITTNSRPAWVTECHTHKKNLFMWISSHFFQCHTSTNEFSSKTLPFTQISSPNLRYLFIDQGKEIGFRFGARMRVILIWGPFLKDSTQMPGQGLWKKMCLISISHLFWLVVSFLCSIKTSFQKYQCV